MKKLITLVCVGIILAAAPAAYSKDVASKMTVELVKPTQDLSQEKALFVSFYTGLYRGKTAQNLGMDDVAKEMDVRFAKEAQQWADAKTGMTALRVMNGGKIAGLAVFKDLESGKTLRLMRCAFDMKQDIFSAGKLLVQKMFVLFPNVQKVVNVVLRESKLEAQLLKQFGFVECPLIDASYDTAKYTSYFLARPKA